jgi:hypothetical protein
MKLFKRPHASRKAGEGQTMFKELHLTGRNPVLQEERPLEAGITCSRPGCEAAEGWRCDYVDPQGQRCGHWCPEHAVRVGDRVWCHRHEAVVRRLSVRSGSIYEIKQLAGLEDRGANLVALVVDELDAEICALLRRHYGDRPGLAIVTDPAVRDSQVVLKRLVENEDGPRVLRQGTVRAWYRGWGVHDSKGYLCRILVHVTDTEPPAVQVAMNSKEVFEAVPDWIARRQAGSTEGSGGEFRAGVVAAVEAGLDEFERAGGLVGSAGWEVLR